MINSMLTFQLFSILITVFVLFLILQLLRKNKMSIKFSLLWIFVDLFLIFCEFFPNILFSIGNLFGIISPTNFVFSVCVAMLLGIVIQLSIEITRQDKHNQDLAEEVAILRTQMNEIKTNRT